MQGLLSSAREEFAHGLLNKIEYVVAAETFDDFLDHAETYYKGKLKAEASVLASVVLEDTVKKIAKKNSRKVDGKSLEPIINNLVDASVFTQLEAKRIKSFAAIRNHALHAEWECSKIGDVDDLIKGTRKLLEDHLGS